SARPHGAHVPQSRTSQILVFERRFTRNPPSAASPRSHPERQTPPRLPVVRARATRRCEEAEIASVPPPQDSGSAPRPTFDQKGRACGQRRPGLSRASRGGSSLPEPAAPDGPPYGDRKNGV